jgi:hypothetical protein
MDRQQSVLKVYIDTQTARLSQSLYRHTHTGSNVISKFTFSKVISKFTYNKVFSKFTKIHRQQGNLKMYIDTHTHRQ